MISNETIEELRGYIGRKIKVIPLGLEGRITYAEMSEYGFKLGVTYYSGGDVKSSSFIPEELKFLDSEAKSFGIQ
jgi:hypothetical protein